MATVFMLPFICVFFIIAQITMLKSKNKRMGTILPFTTFCLSIIIEGYVVFNNHYKANDFLAVLFTMLILNIPTGIMLLMMYIKNGNIKQKEEE